MSRKKIIFLHIDYLLHLNHLKIMCIYSSNLHNFFLIKPKKETHIETNIITFNIKKNYL